MEIKDLQLWLATGLAAVAMLAHLKSFFAGGEKQLQASIDSLSQRVAQAEKTLIEHDRRIQATEAELKHMPDKDAVVELKIALAELKGAFGTLDQEMKSVSRAVGRIDEYLRQERK